MLPGLDTLAPPMVHLGSVRLEGPLAQAALSGYSDLPMRRVARAHGAQYCVHEVVLDENVVRPGKLQREILAVPADDHPVGGQIMGATPERFGAAAGLMVGAGYDVLDINFGCPVPRALGRCRGGYLLSEPETALEIVDRVLEAVDGRTPVTIKMRRGLDATAASERAFFEILDGARARGVAGFTIHGRTVEQRYEGPSDWSFLTRVRRHLGTDVAMLGSGDLFSPFDVVRMLEETGVDGVTIARGCIGNPWIFEQARALLSGEMPEPPTVGRQRAALELHRDTAVAAYGDRRASPKLRTHAIKYAAVHPEPLAAREAFVGVRGLGDFDAVLERFYPADRAAEVSAQLAGLALDAQALKSCGVRGGASASCSPPGAEAP